MQRSRAQRDPQPGNICGMRDRNNRGREQKDVSKREKQKCRDQTSNETGLAHSTPRRRIFASHSVNRDQRRKISPRTNPTPSAVKIALVGFSRTYSSASS